jgi:hypothetical protein
MRAWPAAFQGALPPWTPITSEAALQSQFVKFRIRPDQKLKLAQAAAAGDTSVSAIVRRAALAIAEGRTFNSGGRTDLAAMRSAANELAAAVQATHADPDVSMARIRAAADELHRLAARQLAGIR